MTRYSVHPREVYISFIKKCIQFCFILRRINKLLSSKLPNFKVNLTIHKKENFRHQQ